MFVLKQYQIKTDNLIKAAFYYREKSTCYVSIIGLVDFRVSTISLWLNTDIVSALKRKISKFRRIQKNSNIITDVS